MSNNLSEFLKGIADAIRTKKGTTDLINPQDFACEIEELKTLNVLQNISYLFANDIIYDDFNGSSDDPYYLYFQSKQNNKVIVDYVIENAKNITHVNSLFEGTYLGNFKRLYNYTDEAGNSTYLQLYTYLCEKLFNGGEAVLNFENCKDFSNMFKGTAQIGFDHLSQYYPIKIPNIITTKGENFAYMFNFKSFIAGGIEKNVDGYYFPQLDVSNATNMEGMFKHESTSYSASLFYVDKLRPFNTTEKLTTLKYCFYNQFQLSEMPTFEITSGVKDWSYAFFNCSSLTGTFNFDMSSSSNVSYVLYGCKNLEEIINFPFDRRGNNTANFRNAFPTGTSSSPAKLKRLTFNGGETAWYTIEIQYCSFTREGMIEMFNSLPTYTGTITAKITIKGNPCVTDGTLTDEDKEIATSKNWTLVI